MGKGHVSMSTPPQDEGGSEKVLVPVVYLTRRNSFELQPNGALIAAADLDLAATGTLANSGTLRGNDSLLLAADILNTRGRIVSDGVTDISIHAIALMQVVSGTKNPHLSGLSMDYAVVCGTVRKAYYFPIQKRPNISPSKSSAENSPVIELSAV